jgi:hypothetical protein
MLHLQRFSMPGFLAGEVCNDEASIAEAQRQVDLTIEVQTYCTYQHEAVVQETLRAQESGGRRRGPNRRQGPSAWVHCELSHREAGGW